MSTRRNGVQQQILGGEDDGENRAAAAPPGTNDSPLLRTNASISDPIPPPPQRQQQQQDPVPIHDVEQPQQGDHHEHHQVADVASSAPSNSGAGAGENTGSEGDLGGARRKASPLQPFGVHHESSNEDLDLSSGLELYDDGIDSGGGYSTPPPQRHRSPSPSRGFGGVVGSGDRAAAHGVVEEKATGGRGGGGPTLRGLVEAAADKFNTLLSPGPRDPNLMNRPKETKAVVLDLKSLRSGSDSGRGGGGGTRVTGADRLSVSPPQSPRRPGQDDRTLEGGLLEGRAQREDSATSQVAIGGNSNSLLQGAGDGAAPRGGGRRIVAAEAVHGMKNLLISVNFMKRYISAEAKFFCILVLLIALAALAMVVALLVESYLNERRHRISEDSSICFGVSYETIHTSNFAFNLANIIVNCVFMPWFAIRAVRLEKEGLMVCFAIVTAIHLMRSCYFCFVVLPNTRVSPALAVSSEVIFLSGDAVLLFAGLLSVRVYRGFGWRVYGKGVTAVEHLAQLRRLKQLDAVIKLDSFMTVNTFVSIFFVVAHDGLRIWGLLAAVVTFIALFLAPWAIKRRHAWLIYCFALIAAVMPAFYLYIVVTTLKETSSSYCADTLNTCFVSANITLFPSGGTPSPSLSSWTPPSGDIPLQCPEGVTGQRPCWGNVNCPTNRFTISSGGDDGSVASSYSCIVTSNATFFHCCAAYGRCGLKDVFREHDQVLMLVTAVVGLALRVLVVIFGVRQVRDMNLPSVIALIQQSEGQGRNKNRNFIIAPSDDFIAEMASTRSSSALASTPRGP